MVVEINNKSSGMTTKLSGGWVCGIPEKGGQMVWLAHCFRENKFTEGDQVEVSFRLGCAQIKMCGVHLMYFEDESDVTQYFRTIKQSWDPTLSPYELDTGSTANNRHALDYEGPKGHTGHGQAVHIDLLDYEPSYSGGVNLHAEPLTQGTSHRKKKRSLRRDTVARQLGEVPHPDGATSGKSSGTVQSLADTPLPETVEEDMTPPRLNLSSMFASSGQTPAVQVPTHRATSPLPHESPPAARASKRRTHSMAFPEDTTAADAMSSPSEGPIADTAFALERGDRLVLESDSAFSPDTALGFYRMLNTLVSHITRATLKAMELADRVRAEESEVLRLTDQNTGFLRSINSLTTERDRYKDTVAKLGQDVHASQQELAEERRRRAEAEKNVNTAANRLADKDKEVEQLKGKLQKAQVKGYNQAVEEFQAQLPKVGQKIWAACWEACLTKARVADGLPIWSDDRVSPEEIARIFSGDAPSIPFDETPE